MQVERLDGIDIWTYGLSDRSLTRLTFEGDNIYPSWSADAETVLFAGAVAGAPGGDWTFYRMRADGTGDPSRVMPGDGSQVELVQTPDARRFVYRVGDVARGQGPDIYTILADSTAEPREIAATGYSESSPAVSPDSRWVAYVSSESGRPEVYVRPISEPAGRWQVSSAGGLSPVWARSGRELFYVADGQLMAADVRLSPSFAVSARRPLFPLRGLSISASHARYDMLPGDQRFVFEASGAEETEVVLVTNLLEELRGAR